MQNEYILETHRHTHTCLIAISMHVLFRLACER